MHAFIVSNYEPTSIKVREVLLHQGLDCPASNMLSLELAERKLAGTRADVVVIVLSPEVEQGLSVLRHLRGTVHGRLVVIGPASEPKLIMQTLRDGADQYLDESDPAGELAAVLTRLRAETGAESEQPG